MGGLFRALFTLSFKKYRKIFRISDDEAPISFLYQRVFKFYQRIPALYRRISPFISESPYFISRFHHFTSESPTRKLNRR
jgi:hypothetical protein